MSEAPTAPKRPPLVGCLLATAIVITGFWMLLDAERAEGWLPIAMGLFLVFSASESRGRVWLAGTYLLAAALLLYFGVSQLTGRL